MPDVVEARKNVAAKNQQTMSSNNTKTSAAATVNPNTAVGGAAGVNNATGGGAGGAGGEGGGGPGGPGGVAGGANAAATTNGDENAPPALSEYSKFVLLNNLFLGEGCLSRFDEWR